MSRTFSAKMVNTILFFLHEANDKTLGKIKLAKMLFFADLKAYKESAQTIAEVDYIRMPRGPMPVEFDKTLNSMKKSGLIRRGKRGENPFFPLQPYDSSIFNEEELASLHQVAKDFLSQYTDTVVWLSHKNPAWKYLKHGKYISFALASVDSEEEVKELIAIANKLTATEIIEGSPELLASLKRGIEDARRGKLYPVDSLFE
ncbi:MAG: DUF4065 domain-containing protein [Candidatus Stahlbacteria bacterium]|nr:MAG: DUF4065 domain-containing protein [Candidatus Stahlbacteria bacterium]